LKNQIVYKLKRFEKRVIMKTKKYITAAGLVLCLAAGLLLMDRWKIYKEEMPPVPVIMAEGVEMPFLLNSYSWNGTDSGEDIKETTKKLKAVKADPFTKITVSFSEKPEKLSISRWNQGIEEETEAVEGGTFELSKEAATNTLLIRAEWENGQALYIARADTKKVYSYQDLLPRKGDEYSVMAYEPASQAKGSFYEDFMWGISAVRMGGDLSYVQESYPELNIKSLPAYYVFKGTEIDYSTNSYQDFKAYVIKNGIDK
jgi:hypothetical protein